MWHILIHLIRMIWHSASEEHDHAQLQKIRREALAKRRERVYDAETGKVSTILNREMPAGMVQKVIPGLGMVWTKPKPSNPQELLHPPFPQAALEVVAGIKESLDEVYPKSLEAWEEGLRRVARPEEEVAKWLRISDVYKACKQGKRLSLEAKQDYFKVLLTCSQAPRAQVMNFVRRKAITQPEAQEAIALYYKERN